MSPLSRLRYARDPIRVFYGFNGVATFCYTLTFTVNLIYMVTVVGLDPLQMVLVGTVLEVTCFVFEIPTGIVADLYSRRASVIGVALIGIGFLVQARQGRPSPPSSSPKSSGGIGATFTSGAAKTSITDGIGSDAVVKAFLRSTQIDLCFLSLPMIVS